MKMLPTGSVISKFLTIPFRFYLYDCSGYKGDFEGKQNFLISRILTTLLVVGILVVGYLIYQHIQYRQATTEDYRENVRWEEQVERCDDPYTEMPLWEVEHYCGVKVMNK